MQVVVTGGTGALGTAVVRHLLDKGAEVHVPEFDSRPPDKWDLVNRVTLKTGVDLTDPEAVAAFYKGVPDLWASIHCAGGYAWESVEDATLSPMWAMNAQTAFLCSQAAVERFRSGGPGGRIVNVASRQALMPRMGANTIPYTMSKAAVAALTESLAAEVRDEGILVNAIAPQIMDTPANRKAMPKADRSSWASVEDVARVVGWLVSKDNPVASGAVVPVFG